METTETTTKTNGWAPMSDAVERARELQGRAERLVEDTARTLRSQSEAAIQNVQARSEATVKIVRDNFATAQKAVESQADQFSRLLDLFRQQIDLLEENWKAIVERTAQRLEIATHGDLENLKRKVTTLERKLSELTHSTHAA